VLPENGLRTSFFDIQAPPVEGESHRMSAKLKISAYAILTGLMLWFAWKFHSDYSQINPPGGQAGSTNAVLPGPVATNPAPPAGGRTNAAGQPPRNPAATNAAAGSNSTVTTSSPADEHGAAQETNRGRMVVYLAAFVLAAAGLGLLIAYDLTHFIGVRAVELLFSDRGELMRDPEYERAEAVWADGKALEAVEMMREYLKKHPREQYVALRIAEIYEKDLGNYVAASMEYEEILKKRLPAERWGWAAIHLCNIYSKMGRQEKVKALLERIARDYPHTSAARKARRNLGLPEPEEEAAPVEEPAPATSEQNSEQGPVFDLDEAIASTEEAAAPPPAETDPDAPPDNPPDVPPKPSLPPGFRPKK
jgi:tetratricopeptide (TPR) repeat protein